MEKSPGDWTEENIGEKFLLLIRWPSDHLTIWPSDQLVKSFDHLFRMLKQHLMRQKMPHYFIRWFISSKIGILVFTPQQVEHVRRHSKIGLSKNLIFLPLYPCFYFTASVTRSQTSQTTSWSKPRKRLTTINAQFNELNEKSIISFSLYARCIESEKAQSSTCWTAYPSWNQKRGWCITIKLYQR